jgi:hypothetical protein
METPLLPVLAADTQLLHLGMHVQLAAPPLALLLPPPLVLVSSAQVEMWKMLDAVERQVVLLPLLRLQQRHLPG